jgi:hypothetical protein
MDEEIFELAKEKDLSLEEAEKLQEIVDEWGIDAKDASEFLDL